MCTSIVVNRKKTIVGWNLDLLDMEYRVSSSGSGVFIEIFDEKEGWLPLFGANPEGDFVGMPTCWPYDERSECSGQGNSIIRLNIDLLLGRKTLPEIRETAENEPVYSEPGVTFMGALSDREGNVLHIVPGQGNLYYERPDHAVLTNFSPFKGDSEFHPWMGMDRYKTAEAMIREAGDGFDVADCFGILKAVSQEKCPTVVSMVYDVSGKTVYWCEQRDWDNILSVRFLKQEYIGCCGLDCETCEARLATVRGDDELRVRVAELWSELNGVRITPDMINCTGCRLPGVKTPFCGSICEICKCVADKPFETCGNCPEMDTCKKLEMITGRNRSALENLKMMR